MSTLIVRSRGLLGRAYRINYELLGRSAPCFTNLCHFVRVVFLWLPLKLVLLSMLLAVLFDWVQTDLYDFLLFVSCVIGVMLVIATLQRFNYWFNAHTGMKPEIFRIVHEFIRAKKKKICPLLEIVDD